MIKQNYTNGNIEYTLIRNSGSLALYAGWHKQGKRHVCYELLLYRYVHETQLPNGDFVSARLRPPSSSEWGRQGWTFTDLGRAEAMMSLLGERTAA